MSGPTSQQLNAARRAGLPDAMADRVRGSSDPEMLADARGIVAGLPDPPADHYSPSQAMSARLRGQRDAMRVQPPEHWSAPKDAA